MEQKKKNKIKINNTIYNNIAINYDEKFYITDKIATNSLLSHYQFNYQYLFVALSKNGSLIAMCKTPNYFELGSKKSPIMSYVIVMHQDGKKYYKIKNKELFNKRNVVSLEFNYKEQLYAFCDDGEIFKIDILKEKAQKLDISYSKLTNERILKAKTFQKGFIILTEAGTIFYLKDRKAAGNALEFMVSLRDNLNIKNYQDCDFVVIPENETEENSDEELLIYKPNEDGVYLIKKYKASGAEFRTGGRSENYSDMKVNAFYINSKNVETLNTKKNKRENIDLEAELNDDLNIGPISAIAISDSCKKIALYVAKKKSVFIFSSNIKANDTIKYKQLKVEITADEYDEEVDVKDKNSILNFKNKQLLFLSDDCVAICGGRWLVMINEQNETFVEELNMDKNSKDIKESEPYVYCKGLTEVDGIRLMTKDEIILVRRMPEDLKQVYNTFKATPERILLSSYEKYLAKDPFCNNELREIGDKLPDTIFILIKAAGYLYWVENDQDTVEKKELQSFFLKAANYGKSVFGKDEFNFDRFNNLCMNLRIINALRNYEEMPRLLTLDEYDSLNSDSTDDKILKKTMRQLNFKLAFKISKFLGLPEKDIYLKYAITKIRKIDVEDTEEAEEVYNELMPILKKLENISYIDIAKKCIKYHKYKLGEKFLHYEKSSLVKIPQYLELKDWKNALELAIQSNDINALFVVLDNIYKIEAEKSGNQNRVNKDFIKILVGYPTIKNPVINYLKKNNKPDDLLSYLERLNDQEELFYLLLEDFFKSDNKNQREEILQKIKDFKFDKGDKNEKKFYENYISDLESSLKFKKECIEKGIFGKNDTTNFDNSIFDCFQKAIPNDLEWVEKANKNNYKLSNRKITIMKFNELLKNGKFSEVESIIEKKGIKKLEISYIKIAMMFFNYGQKEKAIEFARKETSDNTLEEKIDFLIKLEQYEEAAELALKVKDNDKFEEIFNNKIGPKVSKDPARAEAIEDIYNRRK